jgi:hypothetical protein
MERGSAKLAGFVLAALLEGDRELRAVERHLAPELAALLRERLQQIPAQSREKARVLRELVALVRGTSELERLPVRARALLAPHVSREAARMYVEHAPSARAGYEVDPGLVSELERLARSQGAEP